MELSKELADKLKEELHSALVAELKGSHESLKIFSDGMHNWMKEADKFKEQNAALLKLLGECVPNLREHLWTLSNDLSEGSDDKFNKLQDLIKKLIAIEQARKEGEK